MSNILIYCPDTGGHRHMYAKVFVDYFRAKGHCVTFAYCGLFKAGSSAWPFKIHHSAYLASFQNDPGVKMLCLHGRFKKRCQVPLIKELQEECDADKTIIVDGDIIQWQLAAQILPWRKKLSRDTVGIFMFSEFIYPAAVPLKKLVEQWLLHGFLFKYKQLLSSHIWLDEIVIKSLRARHYTFIPDIICEPDPMTVPQDEVSFGKRMSKELSLFLENNREKEVVLAFGELEPRKGIDLIYRLVAEDKQLVLIRAGRIKPIMKYNWDLILWGESLYKEGRIFEIPCYLGDVSLIHKLFEMVKVIALPYNQFYRTSGNMLYAIMNRKPVLVPQTGLIYYRVLKHHTGEAYIHGNYDSFREAFYSLMKNADDYAEAVEKYAKEFSMDALTEKLDHAVYGTEEKQRLDLKGFPLRSLDEMIYRRLCFVWHPLKPLLDSIWRVRKKVNLNPVYEQWAILRYERHVKKWWRKHAGGKLIVFGVGKHTKWLHGLVSSMTKGPKVVAVLDEKPDADLVLWGQEVIHPEGWEIDPSVSILLSSDTQQTKMATRCRELFGDTVSLLDLYKGLPQGPYPKRDVSGVEQDER